MVRKVLCAAVLAASIGVAGSAAAQNYEVWLVDQSNNTGLGFGGRISIWNGGTLEGSEGSQPAPNDVIDLGGATAAMCLAQTGANPVRPHMLIFNTAHTHASLAFVASGHVVIFDAAARAPLACFRMSAGAGGVRQAHAAFPSADGTYILVANQNGKLLERIDTDYATNTFTHNVAATLNLATCTTPNALPCQDATLRPDNAPICPIIDSSSTLGFVTLRGGGMFVVDATATPMAIVAEYDAANVHGNGCGGVQSSAAMFINSGGATAGNRSEFDVYRFPLSGYAASNPVNTPAATLVFQDDYNPPTGVCTGDPQCRDSHGMSLAGGSFLWVNDRHRNVIEVFNSSTNAHVNTLDATGALSADPAPDLSDVSPNKKWVFMSTRGPNPLTGDPHVATGDAPGVMVLKVKQNGAGADVVNIVRISNVDGGGVERADGHGVRVRLK